MSEVTTLITDTECYRNLWSVGFKRVQDGKVVVLEKSARQELDRPRLRKLVERCQLVTFNGLGYDRAMLWAAIYGASNEKLKEISDSIIVGGVRRWEVEALLHDHFPEFWRFPRHDFIDLMEPQPNAIASLKTLNGRLHGRRMQDLPYEPDTVLTYEQMDLVNAYMGNDLDATYLLYDALREPLELREALGRAYGADFRSKSDSQIGEAIVKKRVEEISGQRPEKATVRAGTFHYQVPEFIRFVTPELQAILGKIRTTEFVIKADGKVDMPAWLNDCKVTIGESTYAMGIGGLHSTEANRSLYSTDDAVLIDADVASQYPSIILKLGLFPKAIGPDFLKVYGGIKSERVAAKRAGDKVKDKGLKISLNGVYGKLGSKWSVLYAPHLMIAVTLTGQLTLLMLIERAERAGIKVVSGNTDGVLFQCPREKANPLAGVRLADWPEDRDISFSLTLKEITDRWEEETGFDLEFARYRSIHNASVNSYFAVKEDGEVKRKGPYANPWDGKKPDLREQMMKNPQMTICSDAALAYIKDGTPIADTIRACRDIRSFVTVVKVQGGGTWRGEYLGKVVRYIWARGGDEILYKTPDARTGNHKKVSRSDGCRPLMDLPDEFPGDLDYDRYIDAATEILRDVGALERPAPPPKFRSRSDAMRALLQFVVA